MPYKFHPHPCLPCISLQKRLAAAVVISLARAAVAVDVVGGVFIDEDNVVVVSANAGAPVNVDKFLAWRTASID